MKIKPVIISSFIVAILVYLGFVPVVNRHPYISLINSSKVCKISGTVVSSPVRSSTGKTYSFSIKATSCEGNLSNNGIPLKFETDCIGKVNLFVPSAIVESLYPGKLYSLGTTNNDAVLLEAGAIVTADVTSMEEISGIPSYFVSNIKVADWKSKFSYTRALSRLQFKRLMYSWGDAGGLLLALLSGSREYTNPEISDGFKNAGLSHILALSGMHLSLIILLTNSSLGFFFSKKIVNILSLLIIFAFVWFAGLSPSLARALISICIIQICNYSGVKISLPNLLALSFIIQAILFPEHILNVGFMLSYGALWGLYIATKVLYVPLCRIFPPKIANSISASAGAQFCTSPISLCLFGSCMPFGVISAVIVGPFASLFLILGIIGLFLSLSIPFLLGPIGSIMNILYTILRYLVLFFAQLPGITLQ